MKTRISATADWPCDASCQPKCCQLLHNCRNKLYNKSTTNRGYGVRGWPTGRKQATTRQRVNFPWRNFPSPELGTKLQRKLSLFWEIPKFHYNTAWDGWKEAPMPKTSSIRPIVSISHQTYRRTERHTTTPYTVLA